MEEEYDLSAMKSRPNPYARRLKDELTLRVGHDIVEYFGALAEESGLSLESLIQLYLRDCVASRRKLELRWTA